MAALTMLDGRGSTGNYKLLETVAVTNAAATTTVNKGVFVPNAAKNAMFVIDMTLTGTTPLFDFNIKGINVASPSDATITYNTSDAFLLGAAWAGITQATTDTTHIHITVTLGPQIPTDNTGSATADCAYGVTTMLPPVLMYTYIMDGTTHDEDYNGSISVYWDEYPI